jgi:uncharacterized membrane protein YeaQ/YmgE (transglycosylase-associated protein family)
MCAKGEKYMLTAILFWIVLGAIAGWIGSNIAGQGSRVNGWTNVAVGIVGAIIGGLIFNAFGSSGVNGFNLYSILVAVVGSVALLWIVNAIRGSSAHVRT